MLRDLRLSLHHLQSQRAWTPPASPNCFNHSMFPQPLSFRTLILSFRALILSFRAKRGICCPHPNPTARHIDIHRSITPLERPHQLDRHPQGGRNRNPPLRRIPLRRPPSLSPCGEGALARKRVTDKTRRASPSDATDRHRFRRRLSGSPHQNLGARHPADPDRVQPEESNLPARGRPNTYIDEYQCIRRPRRRLSRPARRSGHPPRSRTLRERPPDRREPGRTPRSPRHPHQPSSARASPRPRERILMVTPASHSPIRKPHSRHWHSITRNQAG